MSPHATQEAYPYEIHLTVNNVQRDEFQRACLALNVKPVLLELQSRTNGILADAMTSSRIIGTRTEAAAEIDRISAALVEQYGIAVSRCKLETVPWHPAALDTSNRLLSQYMESHLQLKLPSDFQTDSGQWQALMDFCAEADLHLSRNVFKRNVDEGYTIHMATLRDYTATPDGFSNQVTEVTSHFRAEFGIEIAKTEIEFAVMDSNPQHDDKWLS